MKRVLFVMAVALAVASVASVSAAPAQSTVLTNPFFVFDNGLNGLADPPAVLKELGYAGMGASGFDVLPLVERYRAVGLKVFSTYVGCQLDKSPAYPAAAAEALRKLKGTDVIIWLTVRGGRPGQNDDRAVAVIRELADLAAASDLRLALYPHTGFYVATTADALRVADKVDRDNVGVTINLCHELMTDQEAKLDETIKAAAPKLFLVSINGADHKQPGYRWDRLIQPLGKGNYDVGDFLAKLKAIGYTGPIGLQCYAVKGDKRENLRQSMKAWREYTERLHEQQ